MSEAIHTIASFLVDTVGEWGYLGIFLLMFLESTFFPFPSEVVMIPAGYLSSKGEMDLLLAITSGVAGSLAGALLNYYLAFFLGRRFLLRWGKYLLIKPQTLTKLEDFFAKHGELSTFNGRLIPGVRQLISLPAGLAKMNLATFSFYTTLGAGIWVAILALLGYYIGQNEALLKHYLQNITVGVLGFVALLSVLYFYVKKSTRR